MDICLTKGHIPLSYPGLVTELESGLSRTS